MDELNTPAWQITNCYQQAFPRSRFVGICYRNSDRVDGGYGFQWGEWFQAGRFQALEALLTDDFKAQFPDWDAYIGLMKFKDGESADYFEYWIGMFLPAGCAVPAGYAVVDFDASAAGICWIQGKPDVVFCHEDECSMKMTEAGMKLKPTADGAYYFFERYGCPRFTTPNENGEIILDIGYFVE
ncbi:MAG: hypothetical protein QM689_03775 [Oscillospiraceae bacterium]